MKIAVIMIAVLLMVQTGDAGEDSGSAGPESSFYQVKIWFEKFSLNFVFNQTEKTQRMLDLSEERLREAEGLKNNTEAYEMVMADYADIIEKMRNQTNRTKALKINGNVSIIQRSIIEASSSSGESRINVIAVDGNVSVYSEGGDPIVTRDGNGVTVVSVTNNSMQQVTVRSSQNESASIVVQSSSYASD